MDSRGRLRIAFVADTLNGRIGGGVTSAHHVIERLGQDHEVIAIGADAEGPGRMAGFSVPFTGQREMDFVLAIPDGRKLAQLLAEVDVVHLQFPFFLGRAALKAARRLGRPVLAAFHVQPENALFNVGIRSRWLSRWVYRWWIGGIYNRVDAVIAPTAFAERKLREHGLTTPVTVVSNGVPPDLGQGQPRSEPVAGGTFLILMAGRLAAEKRQELLLEAVRLSRHQERIRLAITGSGPRLKKLQQLSQGLAHPAQIGFVSRQELVGLYHRADLLVHCSEVELEGIAVIEAMGAGLPVLVAQASESAASDLALDDDFRFPAGDAHALAERIDHLVEHPELLQAASRSYQRAALRLNFDDSVGKLVALYRSVMAAPAGGAIAAGSVAPGSV